MTRAIDVTEVVSKRFLEGQVEVADIKINSEEFKSQEGRNIRVSTLEITLKRK